MKEILKAIWVICGFIIGITACPLIIFGFQSSDCFPFIIALVNAAIGSALMTYGPKIIDDMIDDPK